MPAFEGVSETLWFLRGWRRGVRIAIDLPESVSQNSISIHASQNVADP